MKQFSPRELLGNFLWFIYTYLYMYYYKQLSMYIYIQIVYYILSTSVVQKNL